jgi:hypothetical protein
MLWKAGCAPARITARILPEIGGAGFCFAPTTTLIPRGGTTMIRFFHCFTLAALCFIPVSVRANEDTPRAAAMRKILKTKKISVEWKDERMQDIMDELKEKAPGFKYLLDSKGGVSQNTKLSYTGKDQTVEEVLNGLFTKTDFGYFVITVKNNAYDGLVKITKGGERGYEKGKEPKD